MDRKKYNNQYKEKASALNEEKNNVTTVALELGIDRPNIPCQTIV